MLRGVYCRCGFYAFVFVNEFISIKKNKKKKNFLYCNIPIWVKKFFGSGASLLSWAAYPSADNAYIFSITCKASCAAQLIVQQQKTLKRDQWDQETRPPGSGWHELLVELEAPMVGSVDAGAAKDALCQAGQRRNTFLSEITLSAFKIKRCIFENETGIRCIYI